MGERYLVFISTFSNYIVAVAVLAAAVVSVIYPARLFAKIEFNLSDVVVEHTLVKSTLTISGLTAASCPSGKCYLQGAIQQADKKPYFGSTHNSAGNPVPYDSKPKDNNKFGDMFSFTPVDGAWSGELILTIDQSATGYYGPGTYTFKVLRYTGNANSASAETPDVPIQLTLPVPTPTAEPVPTSTQVAIASPTIKPVASVMAVLTKTAPPTPMPTESTVAPTTLAVVLSDQDSVIDSDSDSTQTLGQAVANDVDDQPQDLISSQPNQPSVVGYVFAGATVVVGCILIALSVLPIFVKSMT